MNQFEKQYLEGSHIFFDDQTSFKLTFSCFESISGKSFDELLKSQKSRIRMALQEIEDIESGKIVNKTTHEKESENRAVDHYNLRMKEEKVKGKCLNESIKLWNQINKELEAIRNGSATNDDGQKYRDIIFNGIGGSYLGPLMLLIAMRGENYNVYPRQENENEHRLRFHFVANTDSDSFAKVLERVDLFETIMVNMSKSGGTAETKGNMEAFMEQLENEKLKVGSHMIAITTKGSKLDSIAQENGYLHTYYMNTETGGRTSVGTAIGMVPCALAGIDFEQFLLGESRMDEMTRRGNPRENPAMIIALAIQAEYEQSGSNHKNMIVLGYSDFLKEFAHYLQQLYMESLGKAYDRECRSLQEGQTVFGGVGTGEQHAFMQQVQKGLNDCFVRFVSFLKRENDFQNEKAGSMGRQLLAFVKGTEDALMFNKKPFLSLEYLQRDMFNMGMMVALEERIVSILASFRQVNAYDQPGVQDGKESASTMNAISLTIENCIARLKDNLTGDVNDIRNHFSLSSSSLFFVDAVLSDISANIDVPNAYPKLKGKFKVSRSYENQKFTYSITKCKL
mmetsp:Transcript_2397/g.3483  ORF Transcript_2397/g.3483 Transcript_2397/m.3483 type:complete len:566 (-) Transcript_2397:27-1724(-)